MYSPEEDEGQSEDVAKMGTTLEVNSSKKQQGTHQHPKQNAFSRYDYTMLHLFHCLTHIHIPKMSINHPEMMLNEPRNKVLQINSCKLKPYSVVNPYKKCPRKKVCAK